METADIMKRLRSASMADRTAATYELDREQIRSEAGIIEALRENLRSTDEDLVEITVMRIAVRAKDCASFNQIESIFLSSSNDIVLSACAFGLTSLAECGGKYRTRAISLLSARASKGDSGELNDIYQDQLRALSD